MTDDSFYSFDPQNLNMTDDSSTVTTTILLKTYQDRWQISAIFVSFSRIPSMTDDRFFNFRDTKSEHDRWQITAFFESFSIFLTMTDDSFFFCHVCDWWPWQITGFLTSAHKFQPWQMTAFDFLAQNVTNFSKIVLYLR